MIIIKTGAKSEGIKITSDNKNIYVNCQVYNSDVDKAIRQYKWRLFCIAIKDPDHFGHLLNRLK